jgi:hypothetical protein
MVFITFNNENIKFKMDNSTTVKELKRQIGKRLHIETFYLIYNGKILNDNHCLNYYNIHHNSFIEVLLKLNGGVMEIFEAIFSPILNPFKDIILAIVSLVELLFEIIALFFKVMKIIPTIFKPDKLINDVLYGITNGITSMFNGISKQFDTNESAKEEGIYGDKKNQVCVAPTLINLIVLVVCPPLALYIDRGLKGFFLVIVCALLTYYLYYFPGFLFAALHIMC